MSADVSKFLADMAAIRERQIAAAVRGLDRFGEYVIGQSQRLTPVKHGDLKASGTTLPAEARGAKITKVIGHNEDYAAAVHERMDARHKSGQAKYLETAMRESQEKFEPFMAEQMRNA